MKKVLLLLIPVCFLLGNPAEAQVDTSTTQKLLQYIFSGIDKTQFREVFWASTAARCCRCKHLTGRLPTVTG
jgi:hypothetical protein